MRTALLSACQRSDCGVPRAFLSVGGRKIIEWQAALARDLGYQRILCLCDPGANEINKLQQSLEADGAEFHAIRSTLQIAALVRGDDDLLVLADGLLADRGLTVELAKSGDTIRRSIFTIEPGSDSARQNADVFERIDVAESWAGLAIMRGALAQKLADCPEDGDAISLLLRIALQAGTPVVRLPSDALTDGRWLLASDSETLAQREKELIELSIPRHQWLAPSRSLATMIARRIDPARWASLPIITASAAILLLGVGAALTYLGLSPASLAVVAFAVFLGEIGASSRTISSSLFAVGKPVTSHEQLSVILDVAVIAILILALPRFPFAVLALPVFAWGLARLAAKFAHPRLAPFWNDRTIHLAAFAISAVYGVLAETLAVFGLLALMQIMLRTGALASKPGS